MIQLKAAGKRFGHKLLFEECDWLITPKERTGLVGGSFCGGAVTVSVASGAPLGGDSGQPWGLRIMA